MLISLFPFEMPSSSWVGGLFNRITNRTPLCPSPPYSHPVVFCSQKEVKALFDSLNDYSTKRGDLWGKTVFPVLESKSAKKGSSKTTGGKDGDTAGTSESEDTSVAYNMVLSDAVAAIAGHDTQQYFACKMMFQEIWKIYAVVHDQVQHIKHSTSNTPRP